MQGAETECEVSLQLGDDEIGLPKGSLVEPGVIVKMNYWISRIGVRLFGVYTVNKLFKLEADLVLQVKQKTQLLCVLSGNCFRNLRVVMRGIVLTEGVSVEKKGRRRRKEDEHVTHPHTSTDPEYPNKHTPHAKEMIQFEANL